MAAEADGALDMPQPVANPDAQTTVNDFLDYTEFFPSDLQRSLSLITKLDSSYLDATQRVHDLTAQYGQLPLIPAKERPDPILLRKKIAEALQRAINCREATFAEASRLYEVAERHCQRISVIKRKLQALPQPPSRDPTPAPVSPQASRSLNRGFERTPHLRLTFDGGRHGAGSSARPRDRGRKTTITVPRNRSRAYSMSSSDDSDDSDARSTIDLVAARKLKQQEKTPKPPKTARARPPGVMGTNVHSSVAGISTSNALAKLSPPPPDAKPGSKWAPWFKLTEYEMAVLRKQMKKNAVWTPSPAMVKRELERKGRGQEAYDAEKARCEATGEELLDEEPESLAKMMAARAQQTEAAATATVSAPTTEPAHAPAPAEPLQEGDKEDAVMANDVTKAEEPAKVAKKVTRESQRQQAMRDAQDLEDATKKIRQAADGLKELSFGSNTVTSPTSQRRRSTAKPSNKRKRESSPHTVQSPADEDREASFVSHDSATKPDSKRPRLPQLQPTEPATSSLSPLATIPGAASVSPTSTFAVRSPVAHTPVPPPESAKATTNTVLIPLAPAGPGTPKTVTSVLSDPPSPHTMESPTEPKGPNGGIASAQSQTVATAASSRPRRESAAPSKPSSPPPAPAPSVKSQKASTPGLERAFPSPAPASRPRSARGHVPTPKAQSEEPKPHETGKPARELRRHSIFSQSTISGPTRTSTRKKPPPKGDVSAVEDGQKTVTNVKRSQGSKNKKKKKSDEEQEANEEIDPNEPRYCICDDVSYGPMISCDNNCDREWFHLPCVNITEENIPSRRAKWYCPECRQQLGIDAFGNPLVPPPLPGRRGNRGWST